IGAGRTSIRRFPRRGGCWRGQSSTSSSRPQLTHARRWLWAAQGLVTLAVVAFVARSIARNWTEFRSLHVALTVTPAWIAASALTVLATYIMQIESWRRILAGLPQGLPLATAARTWGLAHLRR